MRQALRLCLLLLFLGTPAAPAAAKDYSAVRFDSTVRVQRDGKLEVTETIAFRFDSGTFEHVVREIPLRRTDSIDVVRAEMDGQHVDHRSIPLVDDSGNHVVKITMGRRM